MDRKAVSSFALIATALAVFQHSPLGFGAAPAARAEPPPVHAGQHVGLADPAPPSPPSPTSQACGIGAACDALIPFRETGPWAASCAWFGTHDSTPRNRAELVILNASAPQPLGQKVTDWCFPAEAKPALDFLVVTLPDPVSTHLALYFDRTVEALEAAAQQHGLFLDQYFLPWPVPGGQTPPGDTAQDVRVTAILNAYRSGQPGLMILSAHEARDGTAPTGGARVVYAFLVSESPTSGINKAQFDNAVQYARVLSRDEPPTVHVVGPFFSGSAASAIALSNNLKSKGVTLDFVSGTLTNLAQAQALRDSVHFKQTLHDDQRAEGFLLDFLKDHGLTRNGGNVAILQEDETRYGGRPTAGEKPAEPRLPKVRYIKFPRELSRLRNAAADHVGTDSSAQSQYAPGSTDPISWNWKDASKDEDALPAYSGSQDALSQQSVLLAIADVIRQENIKYVGISATDIFDILFLSKFLKASAPNTRIFVLDADLLMVKASDEGRELDGTLAVTTYPLISRNADWTEPSHRQASPDVFPSRMSQGIYNAVLFQLDPQSHTGVREYTDPVSDLEGSSANDRPPLWLTIVGRTGLWPISRSRNDPPDRQQAPSPVAANDAVGKVRGGLTFDSPDGFTLFVEASLLIWAMIHLFGLMRQKKAQFSWFRQFLIRDPKPGEVGEPDVPEVPRPQYAQHQTYYLLCATLTLGTMLELIAIPPICLASNGHIAFVKSELIPYLFPIFYLLVGLTGLALTAYAIWIARRPILTGMPLTYVLPSWFLYAATILAWAYLNWRRDGEGLFFAERSFSLSNRVSPLLPVELLLLMYYMWAWAFIRKVRLSESKQVQIPMLTLLGPSGHGLEEYWRDLLAATDDIVFNPKIGKVIFGTFIGVSLIVLRPWETLRSVEGKSYDALVVSLVLFICLLIVMVWGRYLFMWNRLRRILRGLERGPLRRAFSRFPDTYAWTPLWYEDAERRAYAISARSLECIQALVARGGSAAVNGALCATMSQAFERVVSFDTDHGDADDRSAAIRRLQTIFHGAACDILKHDLADHWARSGGSDTLDKIEEHNAEKCVLTRADQRRLLAEEFVALRFVGLIHYQSSQLKNLVALLGVGFVLAVAAVGSYPFLAGRLCVWSLAAAFVVFGAAVVISFAQMDRDAILSRLNGTVAGKLDLSFYLRALSYGGLPLLTLLASEFPSFGHSLMAWVEPTLTALH